MISFNGNILRDIILHMNNDMLLLLPRFRSSVAEHFPRTVNEKDTDEIRRLFQKAVDDTVNEQIEMVFNRERSWYEQNGLTITNPTPPGRFYEAAF